MAFQSRTLRPWKAIVQIDLLRFDAISLGAARANSCHYGSKPKVSMTENHSENSVFRILDAAINRAGEGIRVVEDYLRMVIADAHLAQQLKTLRHDLTEAVAIIDSASRIAARDSEEDVGRQLQTESEYHRDAPDGDSTSASGLVQANLARTQQAIRSIEEFSKTINVEVAKKVEQLRYRTYTLEKAILTTILSLQSLADAKLYVLIGATDFSNDQVDSGVTELVQQLVAANVSLIQLREKTLTDRQLVTLGRLIMKLTRGTKTRLIINDRADLALAAGADGVHLGQDDLTVADARNIMGAAKLVGVSTHSIEDAQCAVLAGANYIGVGPVFSSQTKSFASLAGLRLVEQIAAEIKLPAFAIGGINSRNVEQVIAAGMSRVAVSAAVAKADNPNAVARDLIGQLANH